MQVFKCMLIYSICIPVIFNTLYSSLVVIYILQEDLFYEISDKGSAASGLEQVAFEQPLPAATRTQTRRQKHARSNTTARYTKAKQRHDELQLATSLLEEHSEEDSVMFKVCLSMYASCFYNN